MSTLLKPRVMVIEDNGTHLVFTVSEVSEETYKLLQESKVQDASFKFPKDKRVPAFLKPIIWAIANAFLTATELFNMHGRK